MLREWGPWALGILQVITDCTCWCSSWATLGNQKNARSKKCLFKWSKNVHPMDLIPEHQTHIKVPSGPLPLWCLWGIFSSLCADFHPLSPAHSFPVFPNSASDDPLFQFLRSWFLSHLSSNLLTELKGLDQDLSTSHELTDYHQSLCWSIWHCFCKV